MSDTIFDKTHNFFTILYSEGKVATLLVLMMI